METFGYEIKYINKKPIKYLGKHFSHLKTIEIYTKGRTKEQIDDTLLHELGHVIDYKRRGIVADLMGDSIMGFDGKLRPMSDNDVYFRYSNWEAEAKAIRKEFPRNDSNSTSQKEIWADAYKLYIKSPDKLEKVSPLIYETLKKYLEPQQTTELQTNTLNDMNNYYKVNDAGKFELYFDISTYKSMPDADKSNLKKYFLWSNAKKAWISKSKEGYWAKNIAEKAGLTFQGKDKAMTFQEEIEKKKANAEYRSESYEHRADKSKRTAESLQAEFNKLRKDWFWLTQPIITGHKGSESFGRSKQRVLDRYEKGYKEYDKASYYETKKKLAEDTLKDVSLKNVNYVQNRIKDAEKTINAQTKNIEAYNKALTKEGITENQVEELSGYLQNSIERLKYGYDKLAYYQIALEDLLNKNQGGEIQVFDKELFKELAVYIKSYFKKVHNLSVNVSTSQSFISVIHRPEFPNSIRFSIGSFVYLDRDWNIEKDKDVSMGNINRTYITLSPKDWYKYLKTEGWDFGKQSEDITKEKSALGNELETQNIEDMATTMIREPQEVYYISYLNKDDKFKPTKKQFIGEHAFEDAKKWGKENLPNFNIDMIMKDDLKPQEVLETQNAQEIVNEEVAPIIETEIEQPIIEPIKLDTQYQLGDKWSEDFDDQGMYQAALKSHISWGVTNLQKLHESMESNNYHSIARPLLSAINFLEKGNVEQANVQLLIIKSLVNDLVEPIESESTISIIEWGILIQSLYEKAKKTSSSKDWSDVQRKLIDLMNESQISKDEKIKVLLKYNAMLSFKYKVDIFSKDFVNLEIDFNIWDMLPEIKKATYTKKVSFTPSHTDENLMKIVAPFVSIDTFMRPMLMGVYFDDKGIIATDAHKLLYINKDPQEKGTYCMTKKCFTATSGEESPKGEFPQYKQVIPTNYSDVVSLDILAIKTFIINAELYALLNNKYVDTVAIKYYDDYFHIRANFLLDAIETMEKLGHRELEIALHNPLRAVIICPSHTYTSIYNFNTDLVLVMPLADPDFRIYYDLVDSKVYTVGVEQGSDANPEKIEINSKLNEVRTLKAEIQADKAQKEAEKLAEIKRIEEEKKAEAERQEALRLAEHDRIEAERIKAENIEREKAERTAQIEEYEALIEMIKDEIKSTKKKAEKEEYQALIEMIEEEISNLS